MVSRRKFLLHIPSRNMTLTQLQGLPTTSSNLVLYTHVSPTSSPRGRIPLHGNCASRGDLPLDLVRFHTTKSLKD